jgi:hypothetical protein
MNLAPIFRSRSRRWVLAGGIVVLAAVAFVAYRGGFISPAGNEVQAYFARVRGRYFKPWDIGESLGTNSVPFLIPALTNRNSSSRLRLVNQVNKLDGQIPNSAARWLDNVINAERARSAAAAALRGIARRADGPAALAPYLKHPDGLVCQEIANMLGDADYNLGARRCLPFLSRALSTESNPAIRLSLVINILITERTNTAAQAALKSATASTNANLAARASAFLQRLSTNQ